MRLDCSYQIEPPPQAFGFLSIFDKLPTPGCPPRLCGAARLAPYLRLRAAALRSFVPAYNQQGEGSGPKRPKALSGAGLRSLSVSPTRRSKSQTKGTLKKIAPQRVGGAEACSRLLLRAGRREQWAGPSSDGTRQGQRMHIAQALRNTARLIRLPGRRCNLQCGVKSRSPGAPNEGHDRCHANLGSETCATIHTKLLESPAAMRSARMPCIRP